MTALDKFRLWVAEFFIRQAIVVMPPRQGNVWERYYRTATRQAWGCYWIDTVSGDE